MCKKKLLHILTKKSNQHHNNRVQNGRRGVRRCIKHLLVVMPNIQNIGMGYMTLQ